MIAEYNIQIEKLYLNTIFFFIFVEELPSLIKCTTFNKKNVTYLPENEIFWDIFFPVAVLCPVANISMKLLIAASGLLPYFFTSPSSREFACLRRAASFYFPIPFDCKPQQWNSCPSFQFVWERWEKANSLKWNVPMLILLSPSWSFLDHAIRSIREDLTASPSIKKLKTFTSNYRKSIIYTQDIFFVFCKLNNKFKFRIINKISEVHTKLIKRLQTILKIK